MNVWRFGSARWQNAVKRLPAAFRLSSLKRFSCLFLLGAFLSLGVAACSGGDNGEASAPTEGASPVVARNKDIDVTLVSFAVTKPAHQAIIPKFVEKWKQEKNQNVRFRTSYGGSGTQTRAVIDGLNADIVHLALALDIQKIEKAGLIQPGWEKELPNNGIVSKSVGAIATRPGNPKGIKTWADLGKEGVQVITADPKTSGVARWNFLALWNSVIKAGGDEQKATDFVTQVYSKNIKLLARDAREATDAFFKQGQGDALINYENELVLAQQKGEKIDYIIPDVNISIDNPIAVVDKNVDKNGTREVAEAFTQFLFTPEAQQEFAKVGFRPIREDLAQTKEVKEKYPGVKTLGTVQDFGGWSEVQKKFFEDGAMFDQIQAKR